MASLGFAMHACIYHNPATCMSLTSLTFRKMQRVSLWYAGWCSGAIFRARADWRGPWTGTVLLWFGDESWFDMSVGIYVERARFGG